MISERLKGVILAKLGLDDFDMRDETLASEVPGWDSLTHASVILQVEREFKIRFSGLEVVRLKNLGELQRLVSERSLKN